MLFLISCAVGRLLICLFHGTNEVVLLVFTLETRLTLLFASKYLSYFNSFKQELCENNWFEKVRESKFVLSFCSRRISLANIALLHRRSFTCPLQCTSYTLVSRTRALVLIINTYSISMQVHPEMFFFSNIAHTWVNLIMKAFQNSA